MKWRYLIVLIALCLLPAACSEADLMDQPPVTTVETTPPDSQVPDVPEATATPGDDDNDHGGSHPHVEKAGTNHVEAVSDHPTAGIINTQANPCILHPEDC